MKKNLLNTPLDSGDGPRHIKEHWSQHFFRLMRITVAQILLISITMSVSIAGDSFSQEILDRKVSLELTSSSLKDALAVLEQQAKVKFVYSASALELTDQVTLNVSDEKLSDVLDLLLEPRSITYVVKNELHIVLRPAKEQQAETTQEGIQSGATGQSAEQISGTVTDAISGDPIPGVNVILRGTTVGTVTDVDGNYSLSVPDLQGILVFSYIGYITHEEPVNGRRAIDVGLAEDVQKLNEVVVVGYGTQTKANLTGAVSTIDATKVLRNRPLSNLGTALQGTMPGVHVVSSSGRPGDEPSINIRGMTSINGGSPLILVDNVPMDINDVNPQDIESVSVLKDAAASAIYGGRAAFGVILITTKKASRDEPVKFNYTSNFIISRPSNLPVKASTQEIIDAYQVWGNTSYPTGQDLASWEGLLSDYQLNPSAYPNGTAEIDGLIYPLTEQDVYKKFFGNSIEQMHNFSFSGGTDISDFRVSFGYVDEDGIIITDKDSYQKYNVNLYLNVDLLEGLTSSTNVLYLNDQVSTPARYAAIFTDAVRMPSFTYPNQGLYFEQDGGSKIPYAIPDNYLRLERPDIQNSRNIRLSEKLVYKFNDNLKITGEYTYSNSAQDNINSLSGRQYIGVVGGATLSFFGNPSSYRRANSNSDYHALNLYGNYEKVIGGHRFNLLVGTNQEQRKYSNYWARKTELVDPENPSLSTAIGTMTNDESYDEFAVSGYFSRVNYSLNDRYLIEANIRYDGSSKFPKADRFGLFPSFSAGWIISEESPLKSIQNVISFLKVRGSWGEIGNQSIASYAYIPALSTFDANWIDVSANTRALSITPPELVSPSFTWETVRTRNVGLDLNFRNDQLRTTFDYYVRETLNMLGPGAEIPATLGTTAPNENVANLESKGWDFSLSWNSTKDELDYSITFNLSDNRAYVTKYDNEGGLLSQYYEGYEFGEIWGYTTDRYYRIDDFEEGTLDDKLLNGTLKDGIPIFRGVVNQNPGDILYVDVDGDGEIDPGANTLGDPGDRGIIGNSRQRYQFGLTGYLAYKNFDFSIFINGVGKNDIWPYRNPNNYDEVNRVFWPYNDQYASLYKNHLDYWTPENTDAYYMRSYPFPGGNANQSRSVQTKYLLNGAYISLKNVQLGYSLPEGLLKSLFLDQVRVFVSVENLLKLDYLPQGMDGEVSQTFNHGGVYPFYRKFNLGASISF